MKTATWIKSQANSKADQRVYRLDPPYGGTYDFVVVSAADVPFSGPETYIFPCTADGDITDFGEMEGSYRGGLDHEAALRGMGYEVFGGEIIESEVVS